MKLYKIASLSLAVVFVIVGAVFLFLPDRVVFVFNHLSRTLGMRETPSVGFHFYLILAVGYMYLVALLAGLMFQHPANNAYPMLLAGGKTVTALLSLGFFLFHAPFLIYLANFFVDGLIAAGVWALSRRRLVPR